MWDHYPPLLTFEDWGAFWATFPALPDGIEEAAQWTTIAPGHWRKDTPSPRGWIVMELHHVGSQRYVYLVRLYQPGAAAPAGTASAQAAATIWEFDGGLIGDIGYQAAVPAAQQRCDEAIAEIALGGLPLRISITPVSKESEGPD